MKRILILCTGNSCRSQMAEAFLKSLDPTLEVYSAGTHPATQVHPLAVQVMQEIGIDMAPARPKPIDPFLHRPFHYVITVCDDARETCPVFTGPVEHRLHFSFEDPARATGSREEQLKIFRRVRDLIQTTFTEFYRTHLQT